MTELSLCTLVRPVCSGASNKKEVMVERITPSNKLASASRCKSGPRRRQGPR